MSKVSERTPWSTILKPAASNPLQRNKGKRAIFLGYSRREEGIIHVIIEGTKTTASYSDQFWQVDESYMSKREQIAELMGRIHESNEPTDVEYYRREIEDIEHDMGTRS